MFRVYIKLEENKWIFNEILIGFLGLGIFGMGILGRGNGWMGRIANGLVEDIWLDGYMDRRLMGGWVENRGFGN